MKTLNQIITVLAICGLSVAFGEAQDLAVFKVPDSTRPFLFNLRSPFFPGLSGSTNSTQQGVDGLKTVLAKRFDTERRAGPTRAGVVAIRFYDVIVCQANRSQGEGPGSPVFSTDGYILEYPGDTRILLYGRSVLLADLSEKSFDPPKTFKTYTGEEAKKKLKELGLDAPEDMDWTKATNGASRQPAGATNGSTLIRTRIAIGPNPAADYDSVRDGEKAQAAFSGGDGSSIKDAVIITASSEQAGYRAAYIWSHKHYPGSRLQYEGTDYTDNGTQYLEIKIVTADGKSRTVFFETTSFYGR